MSVNPSSSSAASGSSSGSSSGGGGGGGSGPCGACKFLRRKCVAGCIFAPYFDSEQGAAHFAAVHKVFGASNVSKMLLHIPVHKRLDAVVTICYEAQARLRDPVYGCVAHIFALQQQVVNLQTELSYLQAHLATLELPTPPAPQPHHHPVMIPPPSAILSIADLPTAAAAGVGGSSSSSSTSSSSSVVPATYDLSSLFDPMVHPSWNNTMQMQQRSAVDLIRHQFGGTRTSSAGAAETGTSTTGHHHAAAGGGSGDLQELARELLHRHALSSSTVVMPWTTEPSPLPPHSK